MRAMSPTITIPSELLPADGRFGCGPSKVPTGHVARLAEVSDQLVGTSHRQAGVKDLVGRIREGLATYFGLPEGYEVALGNGGASLFWDAATFQLIERRSWHGVFGEFSTKFADIVAATPHLDEPVRREAAFGARPVVEAVDGVDAYALTHCETSTGVMMPIERPADPHALVLADATSAAGGLAFDPREVDAYYFSPQKGFASDGGLWVALLSPAAIERLERLASERPTPAMLDLQTALANSRKNQTLNTPAVATLQLMAHQIDVLNEAGGLPAVAASCAAKAGTVYAWADKRDWAEPFVTDREARSDVVCTVDLDQAIPAADVSAALRAHGVVDTEGYRKLGRNQLRIATFPAIDPGDVEALLACVDYVAERMGS
jgi:phosphoserine aminotransferase